MFLLDVQPVPQIDNVYQLIFLLVPVVSTFITSLLGLFLSYQNGKNIKKNSLDIADNTDKTEKIHDIVKKL